jgi:hypothetical protein
MSNLLTTALLGLAVIAGSVSGVALAQDSTTKVKPCLGELCPPKSPREDMPKQMMEGANQVKQMQGQDQSSGQVIRKKKQASFHPNRQQQSSGQVMLRKKKQASRDRQQQPSKKAASRSSFWDWLF